MKRGKNIKSSIPHSCVDFTVAVIGTGASAPAVPATGDFRPTTATYPLKSNGISKVAAEIPTRTSAGFYVLTLEHQLPNILFAEATIVKAGGSPTAQLSADVTVIDSVNRQITVKCVIPTGTATDLGTSDMLVVYVHGQDSTS